MHHHHNPKLDVSEAKPNEDVLRMMEMVLKQHQQIIETNARLLERLGAPAFVVSLGKEDK